MSENHWQPNAESTDREFLVEAYKAATKSPDPSTQNGAVIPYCRWSGMIMPISKAAVVPEAMVGYIQSCNNFPIGVVENYARLQRPLKYNFIEHAERNAVFYAARAGIALNNLTMYVPWAACADCARAIICSGIRRVVVHQRMMDATPEHWKESIANAMAMFQESKVEIVSFLGELPEAPQIRFNGQLWQP